MGYLQVLDVLEETVNIGSNCYGFDFVVKIIKDGLFPTIQIIIPIVLVILCTFDLGKAVISSDDKENKKLIKRVLRRCVFAVLLFFLVTIINLVFTMIDEITSNDTLVKWTECWNSLD